jgi:hypothetical protein
MFGGFPQSLQINARILPPLGHDRYSPNPFESTILPLVCSSAADSVVK